MTLWKPTDDAATKGWIDPTDAASYSITSGKFNYIDDKVSGARFHTGYGPTYAGSGNLDLPVSADSTGFASGQAMYAPSEGPYLACAPAVSTSESIPSGWPTGSTEGWIFLLAKPTDGGWLHDAFVAYGSTASSTSARIVGAQGHDVGTTMPIEVSVAGNAAPETANLVGAVDYKNTPVLIGARFASGAVELWVNGVKVADTAAITLATGSSGFARIFRNVSYARVTGWIGNIVVTGALSTTAQRQTYEGFVAWQNGQASTLPTGHPYKSAAPTTGPVELQTRTLSNSTAFDNAHNGELVGTTGGKTAGSTDSLVDHTTGSASPYFALSGLDIVATGNIPAGSYDIDLVETLAGATNSPKTTTFTIVVSAAPAKRLVGVGWGTNSVSPMPAHVAGDLLVRYDYRDGNATAPTVASGWTSVRAPAGANSCSERLSKIVATGSSHTAGSATNATSSIVEVWRPGAGYTLDIGATASSSGATNTWTFPALTLQDASGASDVLAFIGHRSTNQNITAAPTGMTNIASVSDATDQAAGHATSGGVTSWTSKTVTGTGTASGWFSIVAEIKATSAGVTSSRAEAGSASEAQSASLTVSGARAEAGAAADAVSALLGALAAMVEAGSSADAPTATLAVASGASESGSATDSPSAGADASASRSETGSATDTPTAGLAAVATISEAGAALDALGAILALNSSRAEAGSAADAVSAVAQLLAAASESGSAAAAQTASGSFAAGLAESGSAGDQASTGAQISAGVAETGTATEGSAAIAALVASVTEAGALAETVAALLMASAARVDGLASSDVSAAYGAFLSGLSEALAAAAVQSAAAALFASLAEAGAAQDIGVAETALMAAIAEGGALAEQITAILGGGVTNALRRILLSGAITDRIRLEGRFVSTLAGNGLLIRKAS